MEIIPAADDVGEAAPEDVAAGQTCWGLRTDGSRDQKTGSSTTCATCNGTLSVGRRWGDRRDGIVKDVTTGPAWFRDASWGGSCEFRENNGLNTHNSAAKVKDGTSYEKQPPLLCMKQMAHSGAVYSIPECFAVKKEKC
jgi:hypothetical protein